MWTETVECKCIESDEKMDFSIVGQHNQQDTTTVRASHFNSFLTLSQIFNIYFSSLLCFIKMKISNCATVELSKDMFLLKAKNSNLRNLTIQNIGLLILNSRSLAFQKTVSVSLLHVKKIRFRYKIRKINITELETLIQFQTFSCWKKSCQL